MDRRFVLTATVVLLLLALLHPGSQASSMEADSSSISLTPIGLDYLDLPDVPGFGQACVDSAQNIWVMSRDKPCILRYSLKGGFEEVIPWGNPGPLVACDDRNVYFLKDASALRVYDASTMTEKQKYKIPKQVIGEVTMLIRTSNGLYAGNSSGEIGFFSTSRQGTIIHSSAVVKTGKVANMHSFYPCGSGFIALGSDAVAGSNSVNLYYFTRLSIKPKLVHQIHVPPEVVYSTGAIAALGDRVCLNCDSMLKILEDGAFREEIEASRS